jgi:hypothetical protein
MTVCIYAAILLVGKLLTQDYYRGYFFLALIFAVFIFEIIHTIGINRLFKQQKKEMILTSGRLSGVIFSGFFLQWVFQNTIFEYVGIKQMSFFSFSLASILIVIVFISVLAHRDFVKELYKSAMEQYPKAFA